jgi:ABC-type lipoprotein export system ATPase subunit
MGIVFSDYRLAPHLTARENIYLPIKISKLTYDDVFINSLINEFFGDDERRILNRPVHKLSDGQKERVAIIRGLALKPHFLLSDEMFSRVNLELKLRLWEYVVKICKTHDIGVILVSHDPFMIRQKDIFKQKVKICRNVIEEGAVCHPKV